MSGTGSARVSNAGQTAAEPGATDGTAANGRFARRNPDAVPIVRVYSRVATAMGAGDVKGAVVTIVTVAVIAIAAVVVTSVITAPAPKAETQRK